MDSLRAEVSELRKLLLMSNDASFALAGIVARILVEAGAVDRETLAGAIEERAGPIEAEDHNILLRTFARAVRMNFPGGRFDVIAGGKSLFVDPD
jgi:hypothetical protein